MSEVTLIEVLDARERRAFERKNILNESNGVGLSIMMNVPGNIKDSVNYRKVFDISIKHIKEVLNILRIQILVEKIRYENTGPEAFLVLDSQAPHLKEEMIKIESEYSIGRILDLDVYRNNGTLISRKELGYKARKCLICSDDAKICSRSNKHDYYDLVSEIDKIITGLLCE